jgi:hypothetical protein
VNSGGSDREQLSRAFGLVTGIGVYFAVTVGVGLGLGLLVDHFIGGGVTVIALGFVVGVLAGGRGVYRMVMRSVSNQ